MGIDKFKCHGGLIVDEMKLSECFSVGAGGKLKGLVDLGRFTPESEKHIPCDHGTEHWASLLPREI